jgi:hypothetical protein
MKLDENVSVLRVYPQHTDTFVDYIIKTKVDNSFTIQINEAGDGYSITKNGVSVLKKDFDALIKGIHKTTDYEITEKTFHKLGKEDRFVRNYSLKNGEWEFATDTVIHMFDYLVERFFGENLVYKSFVSSYEETPNEQEEFTLVLYKGELPQEFASFLIYINLQGENLI